jgi:hypothetical protein
MEPADRKSPVTGRFEKTHGLSNTDIYVIWCAMRRRCNSNHDKRYARYGARGIAVCAEWDDFSSFYNWAMLHGYRKGLSIDRIDNDGNYNPKNCRWVTISEQNRNYSRNHKITFNGETLCLKDMAEKYGINRATVLYRINAGKPLDEVFKSEDGRSKRWNKVYLQS